MTSEEKRREAIFRKVWLASVTPKYLCENISKVTAQYLRMTNVQKALPRKERKEIAKTGRPSGWRLRIFLRLRKTVFKELNREAAVGKSPYFIAGKFVGISQNLCHAVKNVCLDEYERKLFKKTFGFSPDLEKVIEKEIKKRKAREEKVEVNLGKENLKPKKVPATPSQLAEFHLGIAAGLKGMFNDDLTMAHARPPSEVYVALLLFGKVVQHAPNIHSLYEFLKVGLDKSLPKSPETLEKICRRVGIPLALKTEPRKIPGQIVSGMSGQ